MQYAFFYWLTFIVGMTLIFSPPFFGQLKQENKTPNYFAVLQTPAKEYAAKFIVLIIMIVMSWYFIPLLRNSEKPLSIVASVAVLCGIAIPVETSLRLANYPKHAFELRSRLVVLSITWTTICIGFLWLSNIAGQFSLDKVICSTSPLHNIYVSYKIPFRLIIESWLVALCFCAIIVWQLPVITIGRLAGVAATVITLAIIPIDRVITFVHSGVFEWVNNVVVYVPIFFIKAILYVLIIVGFNEIIDTVRARLEKSVKCPKCGNANSPDMQFCPNCGINLSNEIKE